MTSGAPPADARVVAAVVPLVPAWRVDRTFDYVVPPSLRDGVKVGSLVRIPFGHRNVRGVVVGLREGRPAGRSLEEVAGLVVEEALSAPPLDDVMEWVARRYVAPRGVVFSRVVPPRIRVKARAPSRVSDLPGTGRVQRYSRGDALLDAIRGRRGGTWCMLPVPGDDRGALIAELVGAVGDGAALVAVPEIRYGSTVLDALASFHRDVARVDSARPDRERAEAWLRLARGHGVGAGGRSTVFAPSPDLRLIVLDEEHHPSYKEDRSPAYDGRRVAIRRARASGAVCVLVSSTPSLETGQAMRSGAFRGVQPSREASRAARPVVEVVSTPTDRALSRELHTRMNAVLRSGGRVALLSPRRGYARALWCSACRRSVRCPSCEAGLFYDRSAATVRCARCGHHAAAPDVCPTCGAAEFRFVGTGSERLAEQAARMFPRASVRRVDPDVIEGADQRDLGDADVYVTTWIGTKAAIRPNVSLVGVLDADALIRRPGFRSAETAYHALAEMAEWAGPARSGGRLVIQTADPSHHAVQAVVRADYRFFLEREIDQRAELLYPPFSELITVTATGPRRAALIEQAASVSRGAGARVLGPVAVRAATSGRRQDALEVLLKCADAERVAVELRGILPEVPSGNRLRVDVDPR